MTRRTPTPPTSRRTRRAAQRTARQAARERELARSRGGWNLPGSPLVYLYRAQADMALKDAGQALRNARRANELDVTLLPAYRLIGQALQAEGDLRGSIAPLSTYVLYSAGDAQAWAWLAKAQLDQKNEIVGMLGDAQPNQVFAQLLREVPFETE